MGDVTIRQFLGGRQSAWVGTLAQDGEELRLRLAADWKVPGGYVLVVWKDQRSQSFRMDYSADTLLGDALYRFEEWLNSDSPGRFAVRPIIQGKLIPRPLINR